jgi:hypothetical protein
MAQTKTATSNSKSASKRSSSGGSRARSSSSRSGSNRSRGKTAATARSRSSKSKPSRRTASAPVANAIQRAKGPAIAGGAALVGLAGGLALRNGRKRNGFAMPRPNVNLSLPKPKGSTVKILGGAAKEIAKGGYKIGQLTSEVQKVRKAVEGQDSGK